MSQAEAKSAGPVASTGKGSPEKSLAIKGPPKIISEKLEIASYQGVKVTDINVRPINQSVAKIRAMKEMSSMNSERNAGGSLSHPSMS